MKRLKAVFCSINSKYIHSSLSVWYLFASAKKLCSEAVEVSVIEGTINENEDEIIKRLIDKKPDLIAFQLIYGTLKPYCLSLKKSKPQPQKLKFSLAVLRSASIRNKCFQKILSLTSFPQARAKKVYLCF